MLRGVACCGTGLSGEVSLSEALNILQSGSLSVASCNILARSHDVRCLPTGPASLAAALHLVRASDCSGTATSWRLHILLSLTYRQMSLPLLSKAELSEGFSIATSTGRGKQNILVLTQSHIVA